MRQFLFLLTFVSLRLCGAGVAPLRAEDGAPPAGVPQISSRDVVSCRQVYTPWKFEKERNRYVSFYFYKPDPRKEVYSRQIVVYYPSTEKGKHHYAYYFNIEKEKYWGRCCTPYHTEEYSPTQIKWSVATKADEWGPLEAVDIAVPQSVDRIPISEPPTPPAPNFDEPVNKPDPATKAPDPPSF